MRAGGVHVNDTAKIHCNNPTIDDHCIKFNNNGDDSLRIPLQLFGTFSYFHTRKPTEQELYDCDKLFLTPDASDWNPHCESFERNERAMLNYEGEMNDIGTRSYKPMNLFDTDVENALEIAHVSVDKWEDQIDANISVAYSMPTVSVSTGNNESEEFMHALGLRGEISKVYGTLGSTNVNEFTCANNSLFDEPSTCSIDSLESMLLSMMDPVEATKVQASVNAISADPLTGVSPKLLSKLWCVPENLAKDAIAQSTQLCRHNADNYMSRNISTNDRMLRYRRLQSVFFTDTMFALKHRSTRGNVCCQIFVSDKGFVAVYPMKSQKEFPTALHWFCKQVGVPDSLVADGHKSLQSGEVRRFCDQVGTTLKILEAHTPWTNRAELYIGILKEATRKDLRSSNAPMVLWDYAMERRARIHNAIPRPLFQCNGLSPHTATFGSQKDISNICNYGWYEWIYYRDDGSYPENKEKLGRILGPLANEGNEMAQAILNSNARVITRRTIRRLTTAERHSESEKVKRSTFDAIIKERLGDSIVAPEHPENIPYSDEDEPDLVDLPDDDDPVDENGTAIFEQPITDS